MAAVDFSAAYEGSAGNRCSIALGIGHSGHQQQPSVARRLLELLGEFDRLLTRAS